MTTSLKTLVLNTIKLDAQLQLNAKALITLAKPMSLKAWRNEVAGILGEHYTVEPHVSQKFGWLTFEKDTAAEQMLKKFFRLHPKSDAQQSSAKREPIVAPAKVVKICVDAVLASGMTKAEFNALIAALRESVTFE
jgi:hypothetical protein